MFLIIALYFHLTSVVFDLKNVDAINVDLSDIFPSESLNSEDES